MMTRRCTLNRTRERALDERRSIEDTTQELAAQASTASCLSLLAVSSTYCMTNPRPHFHVPDDATLPSYIRRAEKTLLEYKVKFFCRAAMSKYLSQSHAIRKHKVTQDLYIIADSVGDRESAASNISDTHITTVPSPLSSQLRHHTTYEYSKSTPPPITNGVSSRCTSSRAKTVAFFAPKSVCSCTHPSDSTPKCPICDTARGLEAASTLSVETRSSSRPCRRSRLSFQQHEVNSAASTSYVWPRSRCSPEANLRSERIEGTGTDRSASRDLACPLRKSAVDDAASQ